jgi:hypothetical protein
VNMRTFFPAAGLTLLLAACGGAAAPSPSAASPAAASAAAGGSAAAASKPAAAGATGASEAAGGSATAGGAAAAGSGATGGSGAAVKPAASGAAGGSGAAAKPAASGAVAAGSGAAGGSGGAAKPAASGAAAAKPAAGPTFTDGTVATVDATKLTLAEGGKAFTLAPNTTYVKLEKETPSGVKPGQFVAITAKQQPDNTLLASFLRLQDSSGGRPANQSPMEAFANGQPVTGNLMTNAPVKSVDANSMVVTLPGGDVAVKYAPGIQVVHQADGAASDVKAGGKVLILSRGDAAINVGVYL